MKNKMQNGEFEIVYSARVCLISYDSLMVPVEGEKNEIMRIFFNLEYDGKETSAQSQPMLEEKIPSVKIKLRNFGSPLGTYVKEPVNIGKIRNRNIKVMFSVIKPSGGMPLLDLTVYVEKENAG